MSAAILDNRDKQHEVEDDRESAYHLLNWLALRYTKHDRIHELPHYLAHFDEHYKRDGSEAGGELKMKRFMKPPPINFESCPNLNLLLEELGEAFATRYHKPPSQADHNALEQLDNKIRALEKDIQESVVGVNSEVLDLRLALRDSNYAFRDSNYAFVYTKKMKLLSEKGWLVGVLRRHLESDVWPEDDTAEANFIGTGPLKKRNWEQSQLNARLPVSKHQRLSAVNLEWDLDGSHAKDPLSDDNSP
jgi:hypothetical protein